MHHAALFAVFAVLVAQCYGSVQVQMPEASELTQPDDDLQAQVQELQKNITSLWNYIYELRSAVSYHLTHLRQHQVELETSMHRMEHLHESDLQSAAHHDHHSGEQHSHSGEHHSHGDEHSHGSDHTHGSMDSHSHSDEHHHHDDDHGHYSHSYSHSHSSHDHSKEDSHSHAGHDDHQDHKDSHETEDLQQTEKVVPVAEPVITATNRQEHYHHHHHQSTNSDTLNLLTDHDHNHHHHDHHHDSSYTGRNRTVVPPKFSEYGLYDLAMCRVQPNSVLPEDQKQNIFGTITMWQKKTGGPLNFHVRLQGFEMGDHHAHHQQTIQTEEDNETPPQPMSHSHGFHIHSSGDLTNSCQSTGPHYNPKGVNHGGQDALVRHVGDLGNIECDEHGLTNIVFSDDIASLTGQYSIIGKAIVIHAKEDDKGLGGDAESLKTGNAGTRLACCVIQSIDKIPTRQYKVMKTATQRKN